MDVWERYWTKPRRLLNLCRIIFNVLYVRRIKKFTAHSLILEVGCGTGSCSQLLRGEGYETVGVDISPTACKVSKKRVGNVILADGRSLPFRDKTFSLCFSQGLIEHFSSEDEKWLIKEMSRTSCMIVLSVPKFRGLLHIVHRLFNLIHVKWIFPDEHYYSRGELERTLRDFSSIHWTEGFLFMDLIGFMIPENS
jgi:SAM-dependent methyltransferase